MWNTRTKAKQLKDNKERTNKTNFTSHECEILIPNKGTEGSEGMDIWGERKSWGT